jgi:hypothetical protein
MRLTLPFLFCCFAPPILLLGGCTGSSVDELSHQDPNDREPPPLGGQTDHEIEACTAIGACDSRLGDECMGVLGAADPTEVCLDLIVAASCDDHLAAEPGYLDECYPPCEEASAECSESGETITHCDTIVDGTFRTIESICDNLCVGGGHNRAVSCGESYGELVSHTGGPICWCE